MYEEHSFKSWLIDYQTLSLSLASFVFFFDVKYYVGLHQTNGQASLLIEKIENDKKNSVLLPLKLLLLCGLSNNETDKYFGAVR